MESWFYTIEAWLAQIPEPLGTLVNYTLVFVFLSFLFVLPLVTFTVLIERKVIGFMQHRFGPNRVGPRGWLQTIADAVKLIQKEDITPRLADPVPFWLAPIITFLPGIIGFAVIGMGGMWSEGLTRAGNTTLRDFKIWAPVDLDVSILFLLAMSSITAVGIFMAGWASNNKYSLFGSMRGMAQVISYEVPMILALMAVVVMTGSMSMKDIALKQGPIWWWYERDVAVQVDYVGEQQAQVAALNEAELDAAMLTAMGITAEVAQADQTVLPKSYIHRLPNLTRVRIGTSNELARGPEVVEDGTTVAGTVTELSADGTPGEESADATAAAGVDAVDSAAPTITNQDMAPALLAAALKVLPPTEEGRVQVVPGPVALGWKLISGGIPFIVPMFLGFIIFFITATAETNRSPFDLPEAESELVSGFHTEYTGMKFALFFLGEYANMILVCSVATICFLGAWWVPAFMSPAAQKWPVLYFISYFLKMYFLIYVMIWFRSTFPRLRPDQLMDFAWKWLLPLAMVNLLVVAYLQFADWRWARVLETNYQLWYHNMIKGLEWPIIRALAASIFLPLVPDLFGDNFPKVKRYLVPFLWIFTIGFICEKAIGDSSLLNKQPVLFRMLMDLVWLSSAYLFGMSLITLADRYPSAQRTLKTALFVLMAIIPVASLTGYHSATNPDLAGNLAWVQRILWWAVLLPAFGALYQITSMRAPEKRLTVLSNDAAGGFIPVSHNVGDLDAELTRSSDLTEVYTRARPASIMGPTPPIDWRTAEFLDEPGPRALPEAPAQVPWGPVKPLKGMNTR